MPSRGIMRAKQKRAASLGQGTRFYYLGGNSITRIGGGQGFGKTNPSIGSMRSLGVIKQNRNAGGNNICAETEFINTYYTQQVSVDKELNPGQCVTGSGKAENVLIYKLNSTQLLGVIYACTETLRVIGRNFLPIGFINLPVTFVYQNGGLPGFTGTIISAGSPVKNAEIRAKNCNCRGPKAYCSNCSGRDNPLEAITGGAGYSSTTGFTLITH